MAKAEKFVFVCANQRPPGHPRGSCGAKGSQDVLFKLSELFEIKGLFGKVALTQTGCMGPCGDGPVVAVFPENVWYKNVTLEDVEEIVDAHLVGGTPVERLQMADADWG